MSRRRKSSIDHEAALVDAQLVLLRSQETDYQQLLDDLYARKHLVASQRRELEGRRKELERERVPVHWLPPEMLILVFSEVVKVAKEEEGNEDAFHRAPVVLSHVCSRWRSIALGVSRLWGRISVRSTVWSAEAIEEFLRRSLEAPLDVVFALPEGKIEILQEFKRAEKLLGYLEAHFSRVRSLVVRTRGVAMQKLILQLRVKEFVALQSLELTALSLSHSSASYSSLNPSEFDSSDASSPLRHLRLDRLPLYNIPTPFLAGLTSLELSFPPKRSNTERPNSYMLRLSHLLRLLRETPKLEELVLASTVPYVDVARSDEDAAVMLVNPKVDPIELPHLRSIDWAYPFASDVHYFLSFLVLPALQSIDMGVEEFSALRPHVHLFRGYPESGSGQLWNRIHNLPALRSISLQCVHTDTIASVLRKFTVPLLTQLDISYLANHEPPPPPFPRLESILRDPRLPFLSRLALTKFTIQADSVTAILGYLPALQTLDLTACVGGSALLKALVGGSGRVVLCAQLDDLRLEMCDDVSVADVLKLVETRNRAAGVGVEADKDKDNKTGSGVAPAKRHFLAAPMMPRRPMKKLPRSAAQAVQTQSSTAGEDTNADVTSRMLSLTLQQNLQSYAGGVGTNRKTRIRAVVIDNCANFLEGEREEMVAKLEGLGVERVVLVGM